MLHNMQFVFLSVYKSWIFIQGLHFYANVFKEHANNSRTVFLMCYKPSHGVNSTCFQIFRQTFSKHGKTRFGGTFVFSFPLLLMIICTRTQSDKMKIILFWLSLSFFLEWVFPECCAFLFLSHV